MEQKKCTNCGRLYPEDAAVCPGCKHPNELLAAETEKAEETIRTSNKIINKGNNSGLSKWNTFANVLIWIGAAALLIVFIVCFADKWRSPSMFFFTLAAYMSDLLFCGILKLLAKIEFNTRR